MSSAKNWTINEYEGDVWTTLVDGADGAATLAGVIVANAEHFPIFFGLRLADGAGNVRAELVPSFELAGQTSVTTDLTALIVGSGDLIQVRAGVLGIHFCATGEVE